MGRFDRTHERYVVPTLVRFVGCDSGCQTSFRNTKPWHPTIVKGLCCRAYFVLKSLFVMMAMTETKKKPPIAGGAAIGVLKQ